MLEVILDVRLEVLLRLNLEAIVLNTKQTGLKSVSRNYNKTVRTILFFSYGFGILNHK